MKHEYKYQLYILKVYRMSTSKIRVKNCKYRSAAVMSFKGETKHGHLPPPDLMISQLMMKKHNSILFILSIIIDLIVIGFIMFNLK